MPAASGRSPAHRRQTPQPACLSIASRPRHRTVLFDTEVIVRRQDHPRCASITYMIRHYVARRARVIEDHPHNAAYSAAGLPRTPRRAPLGRQHYAAAALPAHCRWAAGLTRHRSPGCAALGHGTSAPARQGREPGACRRQSGPRASCQNTMSSAAVAPVSW